MAEPLFWVISRPNSLVSFATTLGIEPARVEEQIVFDFAICEFSESLRMDLLEAALVLVAN